MADAIFAVILLYSFIAGARRGFYKEVVQTLALVVSIYITRMFYHQAAESLVTSTGMPHMLGHAVGGVALWVASFFVAAVLGRLILKKIRGKGVDDALGESAEALADAIGGDTTKGPVTLLTDPIATKTGIFYWSDKILGALLGLLKGLITAYILFGIFVFADHANNWNSYFVKSIETSWAAKLYEGAIEPYLATFPEYKIAASLGHLNKIAQLIHDEPWRFVELVTHPELTPLAKSEEIQELRNDEQIKKQWEKRDVKGLLLNEKVRALLGDEGFRKTLGDVNWANVHADVKKVTKAEALKKVIPSLGGKPPTPPSGDDPVDLPEGMSIDLPGVGSGDAGDSGTGDGASETPDDGGGESSTDLSGG